VGKVAGKHIKMDRSNPQGEECAPQQQGQEAFHLDQISLPHPKQAGHGDHPKQQGGDILGIHEIRDGGSEASIVHKYGKILPDLLRVDPPVQQVEKEAGGKTTQERTKIQGNLEGKGHAPADPSEKICQGGAGTPGVLALGQKVKNHHPGADEVGKGGSRDAGGGGEEPEVAVGDEEGGEAEEGGKGVEEGEDPSPRGYWLLLPSLAVADQGGP